MDKSSAPPPYPGLPQNVSRLPGYSENVFSNRGNFGMQPAPPNSFPQHAATGSVPPPPPPPPGILPLGQINQAGVVTLANERVKLYTRQPATVACPHCSAVVVTQTRTEVGSGAWFMCVFMAVVGLWPCCFIPFCISELHDTYHTCPYCQRVIDIYKPM